MKKSLLLFSCFLLTTCSEQAPSPATDWAGRWTGPEGTYLEITPTTDEYEIVITDLDGPRKFEGKANATGLGFTRNGKVENISAGNGEATGMKWLADKKNCLVIKSGEGFCRD